MAYLPCSVQFKDIQEVSLCAEEGRLGSNDQQWEQTKKGEGLGTMISNGNKLKRGKAWEQ